MSEKVVSEKNITKARMIKTFAKNADFPFEKFMGVFVYDVCLKFNE